MVGVFNYLETYEFVNGKDYPLYIMEHKTCLKPPTRYVEPFRAPNHSSC